MDSISFLCEACMDILNELIIDKAFNKKVKLRKRIPFIIIYILVLLMIISLLTFVGINLVIKKSIFGYFFLLMDLLALFMLIYPFIFYKKDVTKWILEMI